MQNLNPCSISYKKQMRIQIQKIKPIIQNFVIISSVVLTVRLYHSGLVFMYVFIYV